MWCLKTLFHEKPRGCTGCCVAWLNALVSDVHLLLHYKNRQDKQSVKGFGSTAGDDLNSLRTSAACPCGLTMQLNAVVSVVPVEGLALMMIVYCCRQN